MKVLVTGGAGFIGSHLCERLIVEGHEPVVIDNLSTGLRTNVPKSVKCCIADCRDRQMLESAAEGCEFVYHLASTVGVGDVVKNPKVCIQNIVGGSDSIFSLGIPGIDFSTSEVYGKNTGLLSESSDFVYSGKARWSYAVSKLAGEWLATAAGWKSIRLFNIVGPRQRPGFVLSNFVAQAKAGKPITVHGNGEQIRTFIDVRDTVDILARLRTKEFDVVNVGAGCTLSMLKLAERVKTVLNSSSKIELMPYSEAYADGFENFEECMARIPDLTRLRSLVGAYEYTPIDKTIEDIGASI